LGWIGGISGWFESELAAVEGIEELFSSEEAASFDKLAHREVEQTERKAKQSQRVKDLKGGMV
jgi:hypothetical protein